MNNLFQASLPYLQQQQQKLQIQGETTSWQSSDPIWNPSGVSGPYPSQSGSVQPQPVWVPQPDGGAAQLAQSLISSSLWVGNVTAKVADTELKTLFSTFGPVETASIKADKNYAFVTFKVSLRRLHACHVLKHGSAPLCVVNTLHHPYRTWRTRSQR